MFYILYKTYNIYKYKMLHYIFSIYLYVLQKYGKEQAKI